MKAAGRGRAVPPPPLAPAPPPFCTLWVTYYTLVAARACGGAWEARDEHRLYEKTRRNGDSLCRALGPRSSAF